MDFQQAVESGDAKRLQELIDAVGLPVDEILSDYALLNYALVKLVNERKTSGHEIAKILIERGCRVNRPHVEPEDTPLHHAVKCCDNIDLIKLLLKKEAIVQLKNCNGETPLHVAVKDKSNTIVDLLLSAMNDLEITNSADNSGLTYLHIACMRNNTIIIDRLLNTNANINCRVRLESPKWPGYTPLHFAVETHSADAIQMLLSNDADVNAITKEGLIPLVTAVLTQNLCIMKMLLRHKADIAWASSCTVYDGYTALHFAVDVPRMLIFRLLLSYKPDVNAKAKSGVTPLFLAVQNSLYDVVAILLNHGADVNCKDFKGYTPLYYAVDTRDEAIVRLLLKTGADVNMQHDNGSTPLHEIACKDYDRRPPKKSKIFLMEQGYAQASLPYDEVEQEERELNNQIHEILNMLMNAKNLTKANPANASGITHFLIACAKSKWDVAKRFLKEGNVNVNDRILEYSFIWQGFTALHFAVQHGNLEMVKMLVERDANVKVLNNYEKTPFHLALESDRRQKEEILNVLLSALNKEVSNSTADIVTITKFHVACMKSDPSEAHRLLISGADIEGAVSAKSSIWPSFTPLHFAVFFQRFETVEMLLVHGANVYVREARGMTPLHLACETNNAKLVQILLDYDADPNCITSSEYGNNTPMHIVCSKLNPDLMMVYFLLNYGADINLEDSRGDVALQYFYQHACQDLSNENINNVIKVHREINKHIFKLKQINALMAQKTNIWHKKLNELFSFNENLKIIKEFLNDCDAEIKRLKTVKINKYSTLYDILFKDLNQMATYVKNNVFQNIFKSKKFFQKFAIYGTFLELQFRKGKLRAVLLKPAKESLQLLTSMTFPDSCSEAIFKYLSNEDLFFLVQTKNNNVIKNK